MLRIGFVGLGAMGLSHAQSVAALCAGKAEVAAVCSRHPEKLEAARQIAPGVRCFSDPDELLRASLDAVFVSTPNDSHFALGREALRRGKHLFLEKPVAIRPRDCRDLVSLAEQSGRVVMIGHEFRYSPYFQKFKALIDSGAVGLPRMTWCREWRGPFQKKSGDWIEDRRRSGGLLVEKNCHHFDLMNWWIGSAPRRVCAFGGNAVNRILPGPEQTNDHATVAFEYASGARGSLNVCLFAFDFPREELELGVAGDQGVLQTRLSTLEIAHWPKGATEPILHHVAVEAGVGWGKHLGSAEMHRDFVDCILEKRQPLTNPAACVDGTLLALAAEESIRRGRIIALRSD